MEPSTEPTSPTSATAFRGEGSLQNLRILMNTDYDAPNLSLSDHHAPVESVNDANEKTDAPEQGRNISLSREKRRRGFADGPTARDSGIREDTSQDVEIKEILRTLRDDIASLEEESQSDMDSFSSCVSTPETGDNGFDYTDMVSNATDHERVMRELDDMFLNEYETAIKDRVVNTDQISPGYQDIFLDRSIIRNLERATTLSLKRADAFTYDILSRQRITGAILYGPPGTGKSALARVHARESGHTMINVTSGDIFQKCWGEDEKVISAIFSLARKLHPCIVFIDEADGIFGTRKSGEKKHIRAMINHFLQEWDGIVADTKSPFILMATNRPFDLDPAVLRRAPDRIYLGMPSKQDREGILRVLLRGEDLDPRVKLSDIASLTRGFTGSDLRALCVTAALVCTENEQPDPVTNSFAAKRVLHKEHFEFALKSVRPTVMSKAVVTQLTSFERR